MTAITHTLVTACQYYCDYSNRLVSNSPTLSGDTLNILIGRLGKFSFERNSSTEIYPARSNITKSFAV